MGIFKAIADSFKAAATSGATMDPNFSASMQMYSPGQPVWSDKNYATYVRNGYRRNPDVYACINKISSAGAGIKWKLYKDQDMKAEIKTHALLTLWKRPNPNVMGTGSFVENIFGYWHMSGNEYMYAFRPTPDAPPLALWNLRPDRMKAVASDSGIQGYVYGYGTPAVQDYDRTEVMHLKFPAYDDDIYGLSPVEVASYMVDQQNEAMGWNTALMQNAGRPASVFMSKSYLTTEQRDQIRNEIRRKYSGKRNAGTPLILEADMTWQNMSLNPAELDWLKSRELNTREIAKIFDIAPELIADSAGKTFANVAEARQALYLENVLPKMDRLRDYLNSWLVPMYPDLAQSGAYFTYDTDDIEALQDLYQKAKTEKEQRAKDHWMSGGLTLNEYREIIGQPPAKFGDVYRFGGVLVSEESLEVYADQSMTEPAAPPSALAEPLNVPVAIPGADPKQPALPAPGGKKYFDRTGIYQPDDVDEQLSALRAKGAEYIKWNTDLYPCDDCISNEGQTVKLGDTFQTGHVLPPAHPHCGCTVSPVNKPRKSRQSVEEHKTHANNTVSISEITVQAGDTGRAVLRTSGKTPGLYQKRERHIPTEYDRNSASQTPEAPTIIYEIDAVDDRSGSVYRAFIRRYE